METTGVVRRIDELGRIVIPKEIRRSLGIKDGASLEIYIEKDMVALKKYSTMSNLVELATIYSETVYNSMHLEMFITDQDNIISCPSSRKKQFLNKKISKFLEECITKRNKMVSEEKTNLHMTDEETIECKYIIYPISANGDIIGLVILISDKNLSNAEKHIVDIAAQFLGKNVEE